jgi:hypothetical protein
MRIPETAEIPEHCENEESREAFLSEAHLSFWRRHRRLMWIGGALLLLLIAAAAAVSVALHRAEPYLRARLLAELEERFHARVELDSFHVSLINGLWAEGNGLRVWPAATASSSNSSAPLIRLAEFRFHAPLHYSPGKPFYVSMVELKGLDVDIPPKMRIAHAGGAAGNSSPVGSGVLKFEVGTVKCTGALLTLETDNPAKPPLVFAIAHLRLTGVGEGRNAMGFDAELTNPRPQGTIKTKGRFGPWSVDDPGETPIAASYRFEHADLATFRGIAGILSSSGEYEGTLRDMDVDGNTDTPAFRLSSGGDALHLRTHFHAEVDGTNGDTRLKSVDATVGRSHLTAQGEIVRVAAVNARNGSPARPGGHDISLTVNVDRGRIEDFLRLATHGEPLLTGTLTMQTSLGVPPGKIPVSDRLRLNGKFLLAGAEFTNTTLQNHIDELSLRGQGRPRDAKNPAAVNVQSSMESDFEMANGVITLPNLKYTVPGAEIDLNGAYGVNGGTLSFKGTAKMQATISQMVGGWKGLLLTPLDRFFKKGGAGTAVPVVIEGTRKNPQFTVDLGRLKRTVPQRPGDTGAS